MRTTWLVPDIYGFIADELEAITIRNWNIRVLSATPASEEIQLRFPDIEFYYVPRKFFVPRTRPELAFLRQLLELHGVKRLLINRWDLYLITGFMRVLGSMDWTEDDVIHSHFAVPSGLGGGVKLNIPVVITLRGYDILTTNDYGAIWSFFVRKNLTSHFLDKATFTVGSKYTYHRAKQILRTDQSLVRIPEGLNFESFAPTRPTATTQTKEEPLGVVFLSVGNLVSVKNHLFLIEVFSLWFRSQSQEACLVICGDGELRIALENKIIELQMESHVILTGQMSRRELVRWYSRADALLHPAKSEGFGNVILEALYLGLPVISSPVGIAPEVIHPGSNGYLPEIADLDEWLEAIELTCQNLDLMKSNVRDIGESTWVDFSISQRAQAYIELYETLLPKNLNVK